MKRLLLHSTLATIFVFLILGAISKATQLSIFNAFDPIGKSLNDMELSDVAFSYIRKDPVPLVDTSIVIINISNLSRAQIAQQIMNINQGHPKVIGIDSFFNCPYGLTDSVNCPMAYDTLGNTLLRFAIAGADNVVMVTKLLQTDSLVNTSGDIDIYDSLEHTDEFIRGDAREGYANLDTDAENQEDLKTCRRFNPVIDVKGNPQLAFATRVAMIYDSVSTSKLLERHNYSEVINYRGNIIDQYAASQYPGRFFTLDWYQALDPNTFVPGLFKDKIVLLGFLGKDFDDTSWDDKFFTPLNKQYAGKARPDMYGVVVHANIISMILHRDYVEEIPDWEKWAIAAVVCFINVALFWIIMERIPDWFDGLSILFQTIQFLAFSAFMVFFFAKESIKLEITTTLAVTAVVGTCFEIYYNVVLAIWSRIKSKKMFTRKEEKVLTTVKD